MPELPLVQQLLQPPIVGLNRPVHQPSQNGRGNAEEAGRIAFDNGLDARAFACWLHPAGERNGK